MQPIRFHLRILAGSLLAALVLTATGAQATVLSYSFDTIQEGSHSRHQVYKESYPQGGSYVFQGYSTDVSIPGGTTLSGTFTFDTALMGNNHSTSPNGDYWMSGAAKWISTDYTVTMNGLETSSVNTENMPGDSRSFLQFNNNYVQLTDYYGRSDSNYIENDRVESRTHIYRYNSLYLNGEAAVETGEVDGKLVPIAFSFPFGNYGIAQTGVVTLFYDYLYDTNNRYLGYELTTEVTHNDARLTNITPTPEPGTWVLMGTGLVGLLGYGWRRRQHQAA